MLGSGVCNGALDADTAVEELYNGHYRELVRVAVLLLGDHGTAEEVVQDAFVAMHGRWHRLRDRDKALPYLRRTVVNGARSVLRHRKVVATHQPAPPADQPGADDAVLAAQRRNRVLDALAELPTRQREVLTLRYFLDMSENEIATTLEISAGSVKRHAFRGTQHLRTLLGSMAQEER